jgi:hypothetical protein
MSHITLSPLTFIETFLFSVTLLFVITASPTSRVFLDRDFFSKQPQPFFSQSAAAVKWHRLSF